MSLDISSIDFAKGAGLVPVVVQDAATLQVLTLAYMDRAALDATLAEVGLPPARTTQDWGDALRLFAAIRQTLTLFRPEVFTRPLDELASASAEQADHEADQTRPWWVRRSLRPSTE